MLVEQFDNVGQQLPLLTRIIISLSSFLANWWPLILAVLLGGVLFGAHSLRQPETRLRFDRAILRLPLAGYLQQVRLRVRRCPCWPRRLRLTVSGGEQQQRANWHHAV